MNKVKQIKRLLSQLADKIKLFTNDDKRLSLKEMPDKLQNGIGYVDEILEKDNLSDFTNNRITQIGNALLMYCNKLLNAKAENVIALKTQCFSNCYKLHSTSFPKCKRLNDNVFLNNCSLENINLPECQSIGNSVFQIDTNCLGNTNYIGEIITQSNADKLQSFIAPKLKFIGKNSFNRNYQISVNYSPDFENDFSVLEVVNSGAFAHTNIKTLKSNTLKAIGSNSFSNNNYLTEVNLPNLIDLNNDYQMELDDDYTYLGYSKSDEIGQNHFSNCISLTKLILPKITYLPDTIISGSTHVEYIDLSSFKPNVNEFSIFNNLPLKELICDISNVNLFGELFTNQTVTINNNNDYVPTTLTNITIKTDSNKFNKFRGLTNIEQVNIENAKAILIDFYGCTNLKYISEIPNVKYIANSSFFNCVNLLGNYKINDIDVLYLPEVVGIGYSSSTGGAGTSTFNGCSQLKHIICDNVAKIGGNDTFANCSNLQSIIIKNKNPSQVSLASINLFYGSNNCKVYFDGNNYLKINGTDWQQIPGKLSGYKICNYNNKQHYISYQKTNITNIDEYDIDFDLFNKSDLGGYVDVNNLTITVMTTITVNPYQITTYIITPDNQKTLHLSTLDDIKEVLQTQYGIIYLGDSTTIDNTFTLNEIL